MTTFHLVHRDSLSCEAIVRETPGGALLMVSQCGGPSEPHKENRVYFWRSTDNGETWGKPEKIWPEDGQAVYQTEVCTLGNDILVFLTLHNGDFLNWKCVVMRSGDDGHTWVNMGEPPCFSKFVFFRGMIRLESGALVMAYQRYPVSDKLNNELIEKGIPLYKAGEFIPYNENGILRSDDNGKTWESCPVVTLLQNREKWHWGEPTVCELEKDHLVMLVRVNGDGYLWRSDSYDGGRTWTEAKRTEIPNPNNKVKLIRIPDGRIALIHTPTNRSFRLTDRYPLEIWISDDYMKTWKYQKRILSFPGAISYPDGFCTPDGRHIRFAIEFNRHDVYYIDHEIEKG